MQSTSETFLQMHWHKQFNYNCHLCVANYVLCQFRLHTETHTHTAAIWIFAIWVVSRAMLHKREDVYFGLCWHPHSASWYKYKMDSQCGVLWTISLECLSFLWFYFHIRYSSFLTVILFHKKSLIIPLHVLIFHLAYTCWGLMKYKSTSLVWLFWSCLIWKGFLFFWIWPRWWHIVLSMRTIK